MARVPDTVSYRGQRWTKDKAKAAAKCFVCVKPIASADECYRPLNFEKSRPKRLCLGCGARVDTGD